MGEQEPRHSLSTFIKQYAREICEQNDVTALRSSRSWTAVAPCPIAAVAAAAAHSYFEVVVVEVVGRGKNKTCFSSEGEDEEESIIH